MNETVLSSESYPQEVSVDGEKFMVFSEKSDISEVVDSAIGKVGEKVDSIVDFLSERNSEEVDEIAEISSVEEERTTVTSSDANGFKKSMLEIVGDYDMVTKIVTYQNASGYASTQVTTELDYPWIFSAFGVILFALFSLFVILKAVMKCFNHLT